jgi:hypothetical protein
MIGKPAMMVEISNNFEKGYSITFQNHRRLPQCRNNHFEEGFSKDLENW